ncbi:Transposase [Enterocloster citroniae]|nr:transposase [Enterocloster citroniae]SFS18857.1 Transposase [Enterocloster citroniae]
MSMNAVGIDVSKRKSTVAILRPGGEVVASPFDVPHLSGCFQPLIQHIRALIGQTRIVMECTGRYYEPVARQLSQAGFFVCAVNPQIIHGFQGQDNPLRRVKTDKADSIKIARYTLDNWANLKQYTLMDELRTQLKTMNRQFDFYLNNSDYLQKAREYGHFTGYKN